MNQELLSILCCPSCGQHLELINYQENSGPSDSAGTVACKTEVTSGVLHCLCGNAYPVVEGVARLIDSAQLTSSQTGEGNKATAVGVKANGNDRNLKNDFDAIRESYSKAWGLFDYSADKTWGWTLDERKKIFLSDVGLTANEVKGKCVLDAGCGNGTLTALLGTLGIEILGVDINDGLGAANTNRSRYAGEQSENVQFVQGNLFFPPVKPQTFDLIYCSGMVHRTPSPKETFGKLVPLVKTGGRLYVWVTGPRSVPVRSFKWAGRQLKHFMSLDSVLLLCRGIAPVYQLAAEALDRVCVINFRKRNVKEVTLDLFESFAPTYCHWHTEEEVLGWFKEHGFTNVHVSGSQKHGFGVYGDKI